MFQMISWVTTELGTGSVVKIGTTPSIYDVGSFSSNDSNSYSIGSYKSGEMHFVTVKGLKPVTKYYYICGDQSDFSKEFSFTTPHSGATKVSFGLIGDIGQTQNSQLTGKSMSTDPEGIDLILHVGDLSYADGDQVRWDSWGRMFEYISATTPWMVLPGNHENEGVGNSPFEAYQARFRMPSVSGSPSSDRNLYWSIDYSWAHIVALSTESDYDTNSVQYAWFVNDMEKVDRSKTPWVIVMFHRPYYNTNYAHQGEVRDFRPTYEPLLAKYCVDIVLSGHVHAYERTKPVYNDKVGTEFPQYFNIGDGGNREGLQYSWYAKTAWSAFRKSAYGYSRMDMFNQTHMQHSWFANDYEYAALYGNMGLLTPMENHVAGDAVLIEKPFPRTCSVQIE
eukprot:TRINITY_DN2525_c0_g2_i3.p1 TRINITY_DN2525_c0_g2~~TRINITY_DN2525_c0_g2_i3.p1  ORF type:complete len:393 (+),score=97.94 TRINITY_DN2525_c0_g2_i3:243-1421(+)